MDGLTIHEAAETTGWSPRMLRYIESAGLVIAPRSASGYRLYGPGELQRLRTLRELLERFDAALSEVAFVARMRSDPELQAAVDAWFETKASRPSDVPADDWLRFEQEKHEALLAMTRNASEPGRQTAPGTPDAPLVQTETE
jgi:MerR family copper efflux transcriptional regulator